jgi:hypothetical protein
MRCCLLLLHSQLQGIAVLAAAAAAAAAAVTGIAPSM